MHNHQNNDCCGEVEKSLKRHKDPVCGMQVTDNISADYKEQKFFFCSNHCMGEFEKTPESYIVK